MAFEWSALRMTEKEFLQDYLKDPDIADNLLSLSKYVTEHGDQVVVVAENRVGGKLGVVYNDGTKTWTVHGSV